MQKSIGKAAKTIRLQTKLVKLALPLQKYFVRKTTNAEVLKPLK
jgi:hypothetical protein